MDPESRGSYIIFFSTTSAILLHVQNLTRSLAVLLFSFLQRSPLAYHKYNIRPWVSGSSYLFFNNPCKRIFKKFASLLITWFAILWTLSLAVLLSSFLLRFVQVYHVSNIKPRVSRFFLSYCCQQPLPVKVSHVQYLEPESRSSSFFFQRSNIEYRLSGFFYLLICSDYFMLITFSIFFIESFGFLSSSFLRLFYSSFKAQSYF